MNKYLHRGGGLLLAVALLFSGCGQGQEQPQTLIEEAVAGEKQEAPVPFLPEESTPKIRTFVREAYLPVGSPMPEQAALESLTDLVLIGGAVWNEEGDVITADETPFQLVEKIQESAPSLALWMTVNPSGRLIRAGTAGQTIDTSEEREQVVENLAEFACQYGLAGIDIDWEYPANAQEWEDFSLLAVQLAKKLDSQGKQLSLTFYPQEVELREEALQAAHRVNIMAYDMFDEEGNHSSYETAEQAIDYFLERGCDSERLVLGIPLYGRPVDKSPRWDFYNTIPTVGNTSQNRYGDSCYNGLELILRKAELAWTENLGGVMLYHLACDLPVEEEASAVRGLADWAVQKAKERLEAET